MRRSALIYLIAFLLVLHSGCSNNEDEWFISGMKPQENMMAPGLTVFNDNGNVSSPDLDPYFNKNVESIIRLHPSDEFRGKKVVLSAEVKTESVNGGAGMFIRVDGAYSGDILGYEDHSYGKVYGNSDWKKYQLVASVLENSSEIVYGLRLRGSGNVWARNIELKEVNSIEVTGMDKPFITDMWFKIGTALEKYEFDYGVHDQSIRSIDKVVDPEFAALSKYSKALELENKELELTAEIKSIDVKGWAGLWMRIDGIRYEGKRSYDTTAAFDNMNDRKIQGTNDWTGYKVVLKVPDEYKGIGYGVLLVGEGQLEIRNFRLRVKN